MRGPKSVQDFRLAGQNVPFKRTFTLPDGLPTASTATPTLTAPLAVDVINLEVSFQ